MSVTLRCTSIDQDVASWTPEGLPTLKFGRVIVRTTAPFAIPDDPDKPALDGVTLRLHYRDLETAAKNGWTRAGDEVLVAMPGWVDSGNRTR